MAPPKRGSCLFTCKDLALGLPHVFDNAEHLSNIHIWDVRIDV